MIPRSLGLVALVAVSALAACGEEPGDASFRCLATHPNRGPADLAMDTFLRVHELPTLEALASACDLAGDPCPPETLISRDAALCLAAAEGLDEGLEGRRAYLVFQHVERAPLWIVQNLTDREDDPHSWSGESVSLDARTGEVVDRGYWLSIE